MRSLVFFALIIGIDLFLKSVKDKKKIQEIREKRIQKLKNTGNTKTAKQTETIIKRETQGSPSISRSSGQDDFWGEGNSYREDNQGYEERYENRYKDIEKGYEDIRESYKDMESDSQSLYDPNAIQRSTKKQYDEDDVRNYGRSNKKTDVIVPKASTLKKDVLKGIIFSEILGKPKSLQKR